MRTLELRDSEWKATRVALGYYADQLEKLEKKELELGILSSATTAARMATASVLEKLAEQPSLMPPEPTPLEAAIAKQEQVREALQEATASIFDAGAIAEWTDDQLEAALAYVAQLRAYRDPMGDQATEPDMPEHVRAAQFPHGVELVADGAAAPTVYAIDIAEEDALEAPGHDTVARSA